MSNENDLAAESDAETPGVTESDVSDDRWSLKAWLSGAAWAIGILLTLLIVVALIIVAPSWASNAQARECLVDSRSEYMSLLDETQSDQEQYYKDVWNQMGRAAEESDNFFSPVGGEALYTGESFCRMVDGLVEELREVADA